MQRFLIPSGVVRWALILAFAVPGFAALPSTTVWEVRPTVGSNTNGGGFVTGSAGTDWSQQNAAQYSLVNGVANGTTLVATISAAADMVGNIAYIAGGTGSITAGWYQVVSEVLGVSITVDRATGLTTGTGVTINIGGALSTIAQANSNASANNVVWIKATGTYTVTTAMSVTNNSGAGLPLSFIGYTSTRGDNGQITWTTATNSVDLVTFTASNNTLFQNILFSSTAGTPGNGFHALSSGTDSTSVYLINSKISGVLNGVLGNFTAESAFNGLYILYSRITACTNIGVENTGGVVFFASEIDNNANDGANWLGIVRGNVSTAWSIANSVFYKNGGNGVNISVSSLGQAINPMLIVNQSDFSTNTDSGILTTNNASPVAIITNSIFDANGTYGVSGSSGSATLQFLFNSNAFFSNGTAQTQNILASPSTITLSASPYVSVGSNFALNSTAGGGGLLRGLGFPGIMPAGTGFASVGALQPSTGAAASQHAYPIVQ